MKFSPSNSLLLLLSLSSFSFAQSADDAASKQLEKGEKSLTAIADAAAETQANKAQKQKSARSKRIKEMQKQRAAFLKDFAEGKARPFPDIVENWDSYTSQVASLTPKYSEYLAAKSPEEKSKLAAPLLLALQPVGPLLQNARHGKYPKNYLTKEKAAEQEKLMNKFNTLASSDDEGKLKLITPDLYYTLKNIPIPITFSAPPKTEIILQSELGGFFENKLLYISLVTNEEGVATTTWSSRGEAVADCNILYRSPEYPSKGSITPIVRRLELIPLERLSPVANVASKKISDPQP